MKKYIFILIILLIVPTISFAENFPGFPMAFYGNVTINGSKAPNGTIIRAYYGDTLAGESIVDSLGAYGDISSTGKKLLVSEGTGLITFTFQSVSILSNRESAGKTTISYLGFEEGLVVNKDLTFSYSIGGGGGGGGGNTITPPAPIIPSAPIVQIEGCIPGNLFSTINGKPCSLGEIPVTPLTMAIQGCGNRTNGFSITTSQSCIGNSINNITPNVSGIKTYNLGTTILKNGSAGEAVKELQRYLNDTLNLGLIVDGMLGPKTINVIKQWQKERGLVPDGFIGPKTKAMMK